jgi:rod shape-determining protein MreD
MSKITPAFAVLAAAVPWGLPADATFILPLVVVMMVFCWRVIPGDVLPPAVAMLLGLLTDIMSGGPLGFWALMTLIAASVGGPARSLASEGELSVLWLVWSALAIALSCFGWLLASLYFLRWIDWWPIAFGAATSIVLFPLVLHGLLWIKRGKLAPTGSVIFRGWT